MDCARKGGDYSKQLQWKFTTYVTFSSPMFRNFDNNGLFICLIRNLWHLIPSAVRSSLGIKGTVKWGYALPNPHGIEYLRKLIGRCFVNNLYD